MAQGDFTKQAEETFFDIIDELNSAEDAIEYLNDKRNTMNFSFELRRFICKKFGDKTKDNKYLVYSKEYRCNISNMIDTSYPHKINFNNSYKKYWFDDFNRWYDKAVNKDEELDIEPFLLKNSDILVAWQILPKGELTIYDYIINEYISSSKHSTYVEDEDLFKKKLKFFKESPYTNRLVGLYGLSGYVGFAYPNEYLICDKFFDSSSERLRYAKEEAIYAAPADRLDALKLSKQQIAVEKRSDSRIKKINHTKNGSFIDKLNNIIKSPRVSKKTFEEALESENKILIKKW